MDHALVQRAARQFTPRRPRRRDPDGAGTLRLCAAVLTAALLVHLGMLLGASHRVAAASPPAAAAEPGDDGHGAGSGPAHAMVATCVAVLSLLAVAGVLGDSPRWRATFAAHLAWVPLAAATRRRRPPSARAPTRVDAGVVLRV